MHPRLLASLFTIAIASVASSASADALDDCHRMGGLHVEWNDLMPNRIIPVCKEAVSAEPEDGYFLFVLGRALNRSGDFAGALEAYTRADELGNAEATTNIGYMYLFGEGVPKDYAKAWSLFRDAVYGFSDTSSVAIAYVYEHGLGFEKDEMRAGELYTLAAKQGRRQAMINLGSMIWNGKGVDKNPAMAIKAYEMASDAGSGTAQLFLAHVYRDGNGVPADPEMAALYYEKALVTGSRAAADDVLEGWPKWPVEVAKALQRRLAKSAQYTGEINGLRTSGTIAAVNVIFDTAPFPPRKPSSKPNN